MKYFLDTNIISYIIKGKHPKIIEHLKKVPAQSIVIPSIVKAFDSDASYFYGLIRHSLTEKGTPVAPK